MKVIVDRERCHSNANCIDECPEVFSLDENDQVVLIAERPPEELRAKVEFAAVCCPRFAITVVD